MMFNIQNKDIIAAMKYIDENGVPHHNQSISYNLVSADGKKYPPVYLMAIANHFANDTEISTKGINSLQAKEYLEKQGFAIETKQPSKFQLKITADIIESTDDRFTTDNLSLGNDYKPIDAYFRKADGSIIKRVREKNERKISNQTLAKIAFQVFEKQISEMSNEDKVNFPVCRYSPSSDLIYGIFTSPEELQKHRKSKSYEFLVYNYEDNKQFVIYSWNVFSTILFVQECLKRFGNPGDEFILIYREKTEEERGGAVVEIPNKKVEKSSLEEDGFRNPFSKALIESKNIIFRGAPGTGKSFLAKKIAADVISKGRCDDFAQLSDEEKKQMEFVQFHPSYDYTDFVEGLRPIVNDDGTMSFELHDGIFKRFVNRARKNYEDSQKTTETIERELSAQEAIDSFFSDFEFGGIKLETINGNEFFVSGMDEKHIYVTIPANAVMNKITVFTDEIRRMLESDQTFNKIKDITSFFGAEYAKQRYSYNFALYKAINAKMVVTSKAGARHIDLKNYVFIIDEINRGEISKIFGELFFSIDPGYRGRAGEISTQYANMHTNSEEKFYIPENVYIIGTMNDIDRSVDSFDFAMRRRFRFIELKANDMAEMLHSLGDLESEARARMIRLNDEIVKTGALNSNYQIGASYFLKCKDISFDQLWTDYLQPLLQEYVQGMDDEEGLMKGFEKAYGYNIVTEEKVNETDQG